MRNSKFDKLINSKDFRRKLYLENIFEHWSYFYMHFVKKYERKFS